MKKYIDIRKMQHHQINSLEKFEVATGELQTFYHINNNVNNNYINYSYLAIAKLTNHFNATSYINQK